MCEQMHPPGVRADDTLVRLKGDFATFHPYLYVSGAQHGAGVKIEPVDKVR